MVALGILLLGLSAGQTGSAATYDLLLKGGHVIDARNGVSAVRDVAIKDGRIAAVVASDRSCGGTEDRGRVGLVRHARADRHPFPRLCRRDLPAGRSAGRVHVPHRHHDRGRPGQRGLADLRRFQDPHHRRLEDPRPRHAEHRRVRHRRRGKARTTWPTWRSSRPWRWRSSTRVSSSASRRRTTPGPSGIRSAVRSRPASSPTSL